MGKYQNYMKQAYRGAGTAYAAYQAHRGYGSKTMHKRASGSRFQQRNPVKKQAGRSSRTTTGKKKTKSILHRKKKVYVSNKLRAKIKKVITALEVKGTYRALRQGSIGVQTTQAGTTDYITVDQGGYPSQLGSVKLPDVLGTNSRWLWATPYTSFVDTDDGHDLQFFTPMKIIDAASVLWNQKRIDGDYSLQAGNLNSVRVKSTGVPVTGSETNMNIAGLKIHVINSYVRMTMKNSTQRSMTVDVYKCVPTTKFPVNLPMGAYLDAIQEEHDGANTAKVASEGVLSLDIDQLFVNPQSEPNQYPSFRSQWKYTKVAIKIAPGETTTINFQGPKDYTVDYDKLKFGELDKSHLAFKQTTMAVMMSVKPDLCFATAEVAFPGQSGRWIQNQTAHNKLIDPISLEWEEVYYLGMPEITGFQNRLASTAQQSLNNRIPRRAYGNFVDSHTNNTNPVYVAYDEENPGDEIPAGIPN